MDKLDAAAIVLPGVDVRVVERCTSTNDLLLKERSAIRRSCWPPRSRPPGAGGAAGAGTARPGPASRSRSAGACAGRRASSPRSRSLPGSPWRARCRPSASARSRLKWPNDLVVDGAKLGGILVETRSGQHAVIGIGLNHRRTPGLEARLGASSPSLNELAPVSRNRVIQAVGVALLEALERFEAQRLDALRADWEAMDAHAGQRLRVRLADGRTLSGIAGRPRGGWLAENSHQARHASRSERPRGLGEGRMILAIDAGNSRVKWGAGTTAAAGRASRPCRSSSSPRRATTSTRSR